MEEAETVITVNNVSKNFLLPQERVTTVKQLVTGITKGSPWRVKATQHALKNISLEIKKGEFFGIVGRNGSGKSTLLKILAGIYQPTSGSTQVVGRLVPFIELGVGFNPELTGRENVYLNGAMLGFSKREVDNMYDSIVSFAELSKFMDQKLKNYSSGMQVRLAFSLAVRANADILLVDEVLAVGDNDFQRKCYDYFKTLKRDKKTVIFVSHDMNAIREYCDRATLIENSKLVKIGSADEIAQDYNKLFMDTTGDSNQQNNDQKKWGDKSAKFTDIKVSLTDKTIVITEILKANKLVENPVVGFRIRDNSGQYITGTNTRIEKVKVPSLATGESVSITWEMPNILSDGTYFIDPAALREDGITVIDWWDEATKFTIKKSRHIGYIIDPGFNLSVEKLK